jgi:hypothetical protein
MHRYVVNLQLPGSSDHPGILIATSLGAPEAFRGSGKDQTRNRRMLQDGARPSRLGRYALHFLPTVAAIFGFIDAAAGGHDYVIGIAGVYVDRKNI